MKTSLIIPLAMRDNTCPKEQEPVIYMYLDDVNSQVVIGTRGVSEYRINRNEFYKEYLRKRLDDHSLTRNDYFKRCLKIAIELSQCIDFEEVKDEPKQICGKSIL